MMEYGKDYMNSDVTIHDVAKRAKVSTATVSRVINHPAAVSEETRQKVSNAIEFLHYTPNRVGSRLRKQHNRTVLIIMPNISNPFYSDIVEGMMDTAEKESYEISICLTRLQADLEFKYLDMLIGNQADGAVVLGCELTDPQVISRLKKCRVVQCCEYSKDAGLPHISIDNLGAAHDAVNYLISFGHRRIGFIGSTNSCVSSIERYEGYKRSLENADIQYDESIVMFADERYSFNSAYEAAIKLLSLDDRPTAIFTISDVIAFAVINAARELGIVVPEELSVFGCDDVEISRILSPRISTINQSGYVMGKRAMKMLIDLLENRNVPQTEIFVEHKLLIRDSTAKTQLIIKENDK